MWILELSVVGKAVARLLRLLVLFLLIAKPVIAEETMGLEDTVCGFKEPIAFWLWSTAAGRPDASRIEGLANVEDISLTTTDGRILRGYRLAAQTSVDTSAVPRGFLLVIQGNAMLADQLLGSFLDYSRDGFDVYLFDYRGYGRSEGKRRLKAIVNDYREIIASIDSRRYSSRLFYAMSFGGIVLLNALPERPLAGRIVIDSTPSRLSDYGCPETFDPVNNIPLDASNLLVIAGERDRVVAPVMSSELRRVAREHDATVLLDPDMGHPFTDRDAVIHRRRLETVQSFLLQGTLPGN